VPPFKFVLLVQLLDSPSDCMLDYQIAVPCSCMQLTESRSLTVCVCVCAATRIVKVAMVKWEGGKPPPQTPSPRSHSQTACPYSPYRVPCHAWYRTIAPYALIALFSATGPRFTLQVMEQCQMRLPVVVSLTTTANSNLPHHNSGHFPF